MLWNQREKSYILKITRDFFQNLSVYFFKFNYITYFKFKGEHAVLKILFYLYYFLLKREREKRRRQTF